MKNPKIGKVRFYDPQTKLGVLTTQDGSILSFRYQGEDRLEEGLTIEYENSWHNSFADNVAILVLSGRS